MIVSVSAVTLLLTLIQPLPVAAASSVSITTRWVRCSSRALSKYACASGA